MTDLNYMQFLSPQIGVLAGKICLQDENVFAHDPTTQFLNTAFNFDPVIGTTVPLAGNTAGVILLPTDWMNLTTMLMDTEGNASTA
jgi:hypothetical protein